MRAHCKEALTGTGGDISRLFVSLHKFKLVKPPSHRIPVNFQCTEVPLSQWQSLAVWQALPHCHCGTVAVC